MSEPCQHDTRPHTPTIREAAVAAYLRDRARLLDHGGQLGATVAGLDRRVADILMGDIGEPRREITVEPIEVPVPVPEKVPA